eukprot:11418239-Karenia_brevis.AAC.1
MKAAAPGAPPDAVAIRRYPGIPVLSVTEYESRQEHLRASRERENVERVEEQNRMREREDWDAFASKTINSTRSRASAADASA